MLRRWIDPRHRKATVVALLCVAALASILSPSAYSDWAKHGMQLLVPFQRPLYHRAWLATGRLQLWLGGEPRPSAVLQRRDAAMENMAVSLSTQLERMRDENSRLRGLRERYVPQGIRLVTAGVVTRGASAARDTLLLSRGAGLDRRPTIREGDAVVSRVFLDIGAESGAAVGHLVVAREFLLGHVDQVSPFVSRVRLFTDVGARTQARLGRLTAARGGAVFTTVDYPCTLVGSGRGEMRIEHVPRKLMAPAESTPGPTQIALGDVVTSAPHLAPLTQAMTIGYVHAIENDPRQPLIVTLRVRPALRAEDIDDVLILAGSEP